jgi:hydrogenase expression/formation protein HypC
VCLAVPGRLEEITDFELLTRRGRVSFAGVLREVNLAFVPEAAPGDYLLVHVGFAISVVDPAKAKATLALIGGDTAEGRGDEVSD